VQTPSYRSIWRPRPKPKQHCARWSAPFLAMLVAQTTETEPLAPPADARAANAYRRAWRLGHPDPFLVVLKPFSCRA